MNYYFQSLNRKKNGWIDWHWNSNQIVIFIKTFSKPYNGAKTFLGKKIIKLTTAKLAKSKYNFHPFQSGLIYKIDKLDVYVACQKGGIILNKKNFSSIGTKLIGKRLSTPKKVIVKSIS